MLANSQTGGAGHLDSGQIFPLVDSILPFEVCLHHQILPLSLKDNTLCLGVVNPEDEVALNYAHQILAYLNCSVVTRQIGAEEHRSLLSAYLYHNTDKPGDESASETAIAPPPDLPKTAATPVPKRSPAREKSPVANEMLPRLELNPKHLGSPPEAIAQLSPPALLPELLARVLAGGIGRLYFERQESKGRILWSQDGVLQSILDDLEPAHFQGVINELKRLVKMPLLPVSQAKQMDIERVYRNTHLLLRLRVVPGTHGEEANLQVLRGAALKFYQQQQLSKLSLDGLRLAQQLQKKLNEIQVRCASATLSSENLPLLHQLLKNVTHQVELLIEQSDKPPDGE
ncbi:MAG: hypothetical protein ACP5D7_14035 [Limnospira sp.]